MLEEVGLCIVILIVVWTSHFFYRWSNPKCNGKLPPGSMGFPLIGDTFRFFTSHSFYEPSPFLTKKVAKYGPLFRAGLLGQKMVVSTNPESIYTLFQHEIRDLELWYGGSVEEVIRDDELISSHGSLHKYVKNLFLHFVGPEKLKTHLFHDMDIATQKHLRAWATVGRVNVKDAAPRMSFEFVARKLMSYDEATQGTELRENLKALVEGLAALPIYFPGTEFYRCVQGYRKAMKTVEEICLRRKDSKMPGNDYLDNIIEEANKHDFLNDNSVTKLVFVILFAGYEATSQAVTLITKLVADHPDVLDELTREHEEILKNRENKNSSDVTWEEYKSMTFTHMVITETIRLGNMVPGIFRKVINDVKIDGYTVPKGWIIMAALPQVHLSSEKYENPFVFDPRRWKGKEMHVGSKTFVGFGIGTRLCVGADFAKVHLSLYLHHLVTKYRWSIYKGGEIVRRPMNIFPNGLHIQIAEK